MSEAVLFGVSFENRFRDRSGSVPMVRRHQSCGDTFRTGAFIWGENPLRD